MSKSKKRKKKGQRRPNLSPMTMLRPRLDGLWGNPDWVDQEESAQQADLTALTKGIKPLDFLPTFAKAYATAPAPAQESLDLTLPSWLQTQGIVDDLQTVIDRHALPPEDIQTAIGWLQATGVDTSAMEVESSTFYRAFIGNDDMGSQGTFGFFWYPSYRHDRVKGISILIDYNPPWEGAAKDVAYLAQAAPERATQNYLDRWQDHELEIKSLSASEAKKLMIDLLLTNRRRDIRLHRDIAALREEFVHHVFTLPDGPETPPFTIEDFDELTQQGKSAESIMMYEQTVGRRVRMEDGTEIMMLGMDDDFFEDE
jgi:hypothetical protein